MSEEDELVVDEIRKKQIVKYEGYPEYVRDLIAQSFYFLYSSHADKCEEEWGYCQTKAEVVDLWLEGKFEMKERITFEEFTMLKDHIRTQLKKAKEREEREKVSGKEECEGDCLDCEEECKYNSPKEDDATRKLKTGNYIY